MTLREAIETVHDPVTRSESTGHAVASHFCGAEAVVVMVDDELLTVERVAVLQRVGLFEGVSGHALVPVARLLDEVRVNSGETFIERGAVEDWLFVIVRGAVRVHIGDRALRNMGPGDVVGELAVLAPAPRSASVTATEPTLLLRLRRRADAPAAGQLGHAASVLVSRRPLILLAGQA